MVDEQEQAAISQDMEKNAVVERADETERESEPKGRSDGELSFDAMKQMAEGGAILGEELLAIDTELRRHGSSLRGVIEHMAKNSFGITLALPHRDTAAYLEKLKREGPERQSRPRRL